MFPNLTYPANVFLFHPTFALGMSKKLIYILSAGTPYCSRISDTSLWILPLLSIAIAPIENMLPNAHGASDPAKMTEALSTIETAGVEMILFSEQADK